MSIFFTIMGETVGLNEYINAERSNRFMGAKMKKDEMERIMWQLPQEILPDRINLTLRAFVKDKRKDPDNIYTFFVKCLLDAMKMKGMIPNDGQANIGRITLEPVEIGEPRVVVTIEH